jgi:hypothetical protein
MNKQHKPKTKVSNQKQRTKTSNKLEKDQATITMELKKKQ